MTRRYRIFLRVNTYYAHDGETGQQTDLCTRDQRKAERLLLAKNEADEQPVLMGGEHLRLEFFIVARSLSLRDERAFTVPRTWPVAPRLPRAHSSANARHRSAGSGAPSWWIASAITSRVHPQSTVS